MAITPGQPTVPFDAAGVSSAPAESGVYAICRADCGYIYFGEAADLRKRLSEHLADRNSRLHRAGAVFFAYERYQSLGIRMARLNKLVASYPTQC